MTVGQKRAAQTADPAVHMRAFHERLFELYFEVLESVVKPKLETIVRQWVAKSDALDGDDAESTMTTAMVLAMDLEIFTPALSGATAFDRIPRRRRTSSAEAEALAAVKRSQLTPLRFLSVNGDGIVEAENLITGGSLSIFNPDIPPGAMRTRVIARLCPAPGSGLFCLIGPVTPLDDAGLAVAMDFVRPGKGIVNDHRCAAAVYRHVVRHGNPIVPGLNTSPDEFDPDAIDLDGATGPTALDTIAMMLAALKPGEDLPQASFNDLRNFASVDSVLEALFKTVVTQQRGIGTLANGYRRIAELILETLHRRASAGSGHDQNPLETIARAIDHEIATEDYPPEAKTLFQELNRGLSANAKPKQRDDALSRVIERIRALRAKTVDQGCTEEEAMAAADKVAELLDRYGLSVSEIDIRQQTCEGIGIDSKRKRAGPLDECLQVIALFCDCRAWHEKTATGTIRSVFFGLPADVAAAHYLFERVTMAFETETAHFQAGAIYADMAGGERRSATNSFQIGLSRGIQIKLHALKKAREANVRTESGRDLVPVKTSVIEEDLAKLGLSFTAKTKSTRRRVLAEAYRAGEVAAQRFEAQDKIS